MSTVLAIGLMVLVAWHISDNNERKERARLQWEMKRSLETRPSLIEETPCEVEQGADVEVTSEADDLARVIEQQGQVIEALVLFAGGRLLPWNYFLVMGADDTAAEKERSSGSMKENWIDTTGCEKNNSSDSIYGWGGLRDLGKCLTGAFDEMELAIAS